MDRSRKIFLAKTLAIFSVIPILLFAYATGPDPGKAGVPGEGTCAEVGCHIGTALNGGPGSVTIDAGGTTYTPGVKQRIKVSIADPNQRRWGFQLTARLASNARTQAGTFERADAFTQVICSTASLIEELCKSTSLQYIEHSSTGSRTTAVGAGLTFEFDWTPPATDVGSIILYAAGNASNASLTETGDRIYTRNLTLTASSGGGGTKPAITQNGVVNGASFQAGIAQNTW
ncbi:MAG: choice-of-anchor V domain-containing protein, partial [Bryobacteraceae bacterium]